MANTISYEWYLTDDDGTSHLYMGKGTKTFNITDTEVTTDPVYIPEGLSSYTKLYCDARITEVDSAYDISSQASSIIQYVDIQRTIDSTYFTDPNVNVFDNIYYTLKDASDNVPSSDISINNSDNAQLLFTLYIHNPNITSNMSTVDLDTSTPPGSWGSVVDYDTDQTWTLKVTSNNSSKLLVAQKSTDTFTDSITVSGETSHNGDTAFNIYGQVQNGSTGSVTIKYGYSSDDYDLSINNSGRQINVTISAVLSGSSAIFMDIDDENITE